MSVVKFVVIASACAVALLLASGSPCAAQAVDRTPTSAAAKKSPTSAPKPYKPVAVTPPSAPDDPGLATFRRDLAGVAQRRVYGELAAVVIAQGFFWDRDFDGGFDPKKTATENLAAALRLESRDGSGWRLLAALAGEASIWPIPSRLGVVCTPANATYDDVELDNVIDTTRTDALEWSYPRADRTPVRATPRVDAPLVDTLGLHFVRVLGFEAKDGGPDPQRTAWARIATPSGKIGFVAPATLLSPYAERLCFGKDALGRWRIAGYVGGGD